MARLALVTTVAGAAVIAVLGGVVALIFDVAWSDGIGAVCVVGSVVWLAAGLGTFIGWVVAGPGRPQTRTAGAAALGLLVIAGAWFEVRFVAYNGCVSSSGDQPALTVPISLVTEEPVWSGGTLRDPLPCDRKEERAYEVGPFGDVP